MGYRRGEPRAPAAGRGLNPGQFKVQKVIRNTR
jgi:hypothetical protein